MGSHLVSDTEHIETELSVNYQKKKEKEKRHKQKHCHMKKVFYGGGVCNLAVIFNIFSFLMKSREWCVCNCNLKKMFMGFHLKIKIIHRHIWVEKRKFCRLKISWACITGQIVFVLESFGSKATRSELLLLILHMALQLDLYQNFVHTFNPASSYAG